MKLSKQEKEKLEKFLNQIDDNNNNCSGVVGAMINKYQEGYLNGVNAVLNLLNIK